MTLRLLRTILRFGLVAPALAALPVSPAAAQRFEPAPVWPLCGNITANKPSGWIVGDDCPSNRAGDPAHADGPISDTFGPRLAANGLDFDWHRGIDLPVPAGTPVFAIAAGQVVTADNPTIDKTIMIRHPRPGNQPATSCTPNGCWFSRYLHLSEIRSGIAVGTNVTRGQYIGKTGRPEESSFYHLHFEIRSAIDAENDGSQREAIHPLAVLPRAESGSGGVDSTMTVAFATDAAAHGSAPAVDDSDPEHPVVTVRVTLPDASQELELDRVEVTVYENLGDALAVVPQPNDFAGTSLTPENETWQVNPAWFDLETWNRQFTYKNSYGVAYATFRTGGANQSPWHAGLPATWNGVTTPDHHLTHRKFDDTGVSGDRKLLAFNGVEVYAPKFNDSNSFNQYHLYVTFRQLDGVEDALDLCLEAVARDVRGNRSAVAQWGNCAVTP